MTKIKLPEVSSKYGAPMGRANQKLTGKCRLQLVPMSPCGAYDSGGAYWGCISWKDKVYPLYVAEDLNGNRAFIRAISRNAAKLGLENISPKPENLSFYC